MNIDWSSIPDSDRDILSLSRLSPHIVQVISEIALSRSWRFIWWRLLNAWSFTCTPPRCFCGVFCALLIDWNYCFTRTITFTELYRVVLLSYSLAR
jgi:hypothetical protein